MGTSSKDIDLIIKSTDLSSKPLGAIGEAVDKLVQSVASLVPASEKGEAGLNELKAVATGLKTALEGLKNNKALIETFDLLNTSIAEGAAKLALYQERLAAAKTALDGAANPTKLLKDNLQSAQVAFSDQEKFVNRSVTALEKLRVKASEVGLDLNQITIAQDKINTTLAVAAPAYEKVNTLINTFADTQRRIATETAAAAVAEAEAAKIAQAAAVEQAKALQVQRNAQNEAAAAENDYRVMLERTYASVKKKAEADAQAASAFKEEVLAVEAARSKITAKVVADNEAAAAALKLAQAEETEAAAAREVAEAAAKVVAAEKQQAAEHAALAARYTELTGKQINATTGLAEAHGKAAGGFKLFNDGGRESLSVSQRLIGQLRSLTAAYVGVFGAINAVGSILDAVKQRNTVTNVLESAFGKEDVGAQLAYVRDQAERTGFRFLDLAEQYGKFAIAAKSAGLEVREIRIIFEGFTEVSRALHLSQDQTNLIFLALTQIASKGKFAMQELRQQLGNDLPGAFGTLAAAVGKTDKELEALLGGDGISAKFLPAFATAFREKFAGAVGGSLDTVVANTARFGTALDDLKLIIADGGFLDAFNNALKKLIVFFKSDDGKKFAENLGTALTKVTDFVILLLDHFKQVEDIIVLIAEVKAAQFAINMVKSVGLVVVETIRLRDGLDAGVKAATRLQVVLTGLSVGAATFIAAWDIGTFLYNNLRFVRTFAETWVGINIVAMDSIRVWWMQHMPRWLGGGGTPEELANLKAALAGEQAALADLFKNGAGGAAFGASEDTVTPAVVKPAATTEMTDAEKQAAKDLIAMDSLKALEKASREMENRLSELRGTLLKKDATSFAEYRAALQTQYQGLFTEIAALGDKFQGAGIAKAKELKAQLNSLLDIAATNAFNTFQENKAKNDLQAINGLLRERNDLIAGEKTLSSKDVHAESTETARANMAAISAEFNAKIVSQIDKLNAFLNTLPVNVQAKLQKVVQDLRIVQTQLIDRPAVDPVADIEKQVQGINDQLRVRDALIEAQRAKETAGLQTQQQTITNVKNITDEYSTQLDALKLIRDQIEQSVGLTAEQKQLLIETAAKIDIVLARQKEVRQSIYTAKQAGEDLANIGVGIADAFVKAAVASGSLSDGFKAAGQAFRTLAADFLLKIGEMILKQALLNALSSASSSGSSIASILASAVSAAATAHDGGVVDQKAAMRSINNSVFVGARRYHDGGLPGLSPGEVPIIAKKGEEVLTGNDPRNVMNGGRDSRQPMQVQVHNHIDSESVTQAGLAAPSNVKTILNIIRANRASLKGALA